MFESNSLQEFNRIMKNKELETLFEPIINQTLVGRLASKSNIVTVSLDTKNEVVSSIFEEHPALNSIVVLDNNSPVGLIMRDDFYSYLGKKFGYSLYIDKNVKLIMNDSPLVVSANTYLPEVSKLAMERDLEDLYDPIIVIDGRKFLGVISVKKVLEELTNLKVEEAINLNPLTKLPGNNIIKREITNRIKSDFKFSVLYIDLDNFKAYNDYYGYQKGDQIINFTAKLLRSVVDETASKTDFIGHIGGDDFVIVTEVAKDKLISKKIIKQFDAAIGDFFNAEDRKKGHIKVKNRRGEICKTPLTSISIAIVSNEQREINSAVQVSDIAANIKKHVKRQSGSNFLKDRRTN